MLKIFQARIQQHMNQELPDVKDKFRKVRGTRNQVANIHWIIEKAREFQKNIYFCFIYYSKGFDCVDHNKLWEILQDMGIPDHLTWLLKICMQVKKQRWEPDVEQWTGSKLGKEYVKAVYCHPAYLTYMFSTSWEMLDWIAGRNINNLRYADISTLMAESKEELKILLMKLKNENHGIQYQHFMADRWGNNGNSGRIYFGGVQNPWRWWQQPWNWKMIAP